jgi:hypothetical protein
MRYLVSHLKERSYFEGVSEHSPKENKREEGTRGCTMLHNDKLQIYILAKYYYDNPAEKKEIGGT